MRARGMEQSLGKVGRRSADDPLLLAQLDDLRFPLAFCSTGTSVACYTAVDGAIAARSGTLDSSPIFPLTCLFSSSHPLLAHRSRTHSLHVTRFSRAPVPPFPPLRFPRLDDLETGGGGTSTLAPPPHKTRPPSTKSSDDDSRLHDEAMEEPMAVREELRG